MNRARAPLAGLFGILGFLLGGAWGFWNAWQTSPEHGAHSQAESMVAQVPTLPEISAPADDPLQGLPAEALPFAGHLTLLDHIAKAKVEDLPGLLMEIAAMTESQTYALQKALWDRWVELDPEGGFAYVQTAPSPPFTPPQRGSMVWEYLGRWSLRDPDTAVSRMQTLPEQYDRSVAVSRITQALAAERPADFFRLLPEMSAYGGDTYHNLGKAAVRYGAIDPEGAVKAIGEMKIRGRGDMLAGIVSGWAKHDSAAALSWVRGLEDQGERRLALQSVAGRLILENPALAAEVYRESGPAEQQSGNSAGTSGEEVSPLSLAKKLADQDPLAAVEWLTKHFPDQDPKGLQQLAMEGLPHDAAAAVEYIIKIPENIFSEGKPPSWPADSWIPTDPAAGLEKAASITDPVRREFMRAALLGAQAGTDPQTAITAAEQLLTDNNSRRHVMRKALRAWAGQDLTAASAWLAEQPPGSERDSAIAGFNEVAQVAEPASALVWAAAVNDSELREQEFVRVLSHWRTTDPEAAEAAIMELNIPEEDKAAISKKVFPGQR